MLKKKQYYSLPDSDVLRLNDFLTKNTRNNFWKKSFPPILLRFFTYKNSSVEQGLIPELVVATVRSVLIFAEGCIWKVIRTPPSANTHPLIFCCSCHLSENCCIRFENEC